MKNLTFRVFAHFIKGVHCLESFEGVLKSLNLGLGRVLGENVTLVRVPRYRPPPSITSENSSAKLEHKVAALLEDPS